MSLALLTPVQHHLIPRAALSAHTKWPRKAPAWYFHFWVLLQIGAWASREWQRGVWAAQVGACHGSARRRRAGHCLLALHWAPSPTISSCSCHGLAHSCTPIQQPHSCCVEHSWAAVNRYALKARHVVTEAGDIQKCNCRAASRKSLLIIISSELYLLRTECSSAWGLVVGVSYWDIQKGNKGKRF